MSATSFTLLDIVKKVSARIDGIPPYVESVSDPDPKLKLLVDLVNDVLREMLRYGDPVEVTGHTILRTIGNYDSSSGTDCYITDVTRSTLAIVGTGTSWNTEAEDSYLTAGSALVLTDSGNAYTGAVLRVASVGSDTAAVLESWPWPDLSSEELAYSSYHDRYTLPADFKEAISLSIEGAYTSTIGFISPAEMDAIRHDLRAYPYDTGPPRRATVRRTLGGLWVLELDPFPDDSYPIQVEYKKMLATEVTTDTAAIPIADEHVDILVRGVVAHWREVHGKTREHERPVHEWRRGDLSVYCMASSSNASNRTRIVPDPTYDRGPMRSSSADISSSFDLA